MFAIDFHKILDSGEKSGEVGIFYFVFIRQQFLTVDLCRKLECEYIITIAMRDPQKFDIT